MVKFFKQIKPAGKVFVTVVLPIIAIVISGYAIYIDNAHYNETKELTEQHTKHQEIYNKLARLDNRIEQAREYIKHQASDDENVSDYEKYLFDVQKLRDEADKAWLNENYEDSNRLINEAYDLVIKIPTLSYELGWWLIGGIIAGFIAISLVIFLVVVMRIKKNVSV